MNPIKDTVQTFWSGILQSRGKGILPTDQPHIFVTLFFAVFSTVTGVGIVVPLLPIYARDLGAAGIYVGLVFGAFSISRTLLLPLFGRLSDQRGRKPFIVGGLLSYTLISVLFVFSCHVETLIILRFIQGAASAMILPVVQAYIGEITHEGREGYSMGIFNLSMFLSLSLGPLMGGVIKDIFSLDAAFVSMGVLSAVGLLLCVVLLPPLSEENFRAREGKTPPWKGLIRDPELISIFLFRFVYVVCIGVIWGFLPLFADREFGISGTQTGFLVMLGVFVAGLLQIPMGYLADRISKKAMIISGGIISTIGMILPYTSASFSDLTFAMIIFGIGGGISMPPIMAYAVIKGDERKAMGSVISIITVAHSLGMFIGSMAAGLAMDFFSLNLAFPLGAAVMLSGTLVFGWIMVLSKNH